MVHSDTVHICVLHRSLYFMISSVHHTLGLKTSGSAAGLRKSRGKPVLANNGELFKELMSSLTEEALERTVKCVPLILEEQETSTAGVAAVLPDLVGVVPSSLKLNTLSQFKNEIKAGPCRIGSPECAVTESQKQWLRNVLESEYVLYNRAVEYANQLASCGGDRS
jgi:hypothetical protein